MAKRKAVAENKPRMLKSVNEKLAQLYTKTGQFERAAGYISRLYETAATAEAKKAILPDLLYVYLRLPKVELAAGLVEQCLIERDLDPNDVVVSSLDEYLAKPPAGADPNVLLETLSKIEIPQARPLWQDRLRQWAIRFGKAKAAGKSEPDGT